MTRAFASIIAILLAIQATAAEPDPTWTKLAPYFSPPSEYANQLAPYRSPLKFDDGTEVRDTKDWPRRRDEILRKWHGVMGPWPALLEHPRLEILKETPRDGHTEYTVRVQVAAEQSLDGYLLRPNGITPPPGHIPCPPWTQTTWAREVSYSLE